jgi:cyclic beta-1,2-glucan synthetase
MKVQPIRFALGFYSAEVGEPETAWKGASARGGRAYLLTESSSAAKEIERYAALRLPGETLVVAEAELGQVEAIFKRFQSTGSTAVFVLRADLDKLCPEDAKPQFAPSETGLLEEWAHGCAERRDDSNKTKLDIFARLQENEEALDCVHADLESAARMGHALTGAAEWMLDNSYLVRIQRAEIRRHLPRNYREILPSLTPVYDLAREYTERSDQSVNEGNITAWLRAYQERKPLTIAELWFFPLLLRMALIEGLGHLGDRVDRAQQLREAAYLWANRLAASARREGAEFEAMLRRMEAEPIALQPYFVATLVEQLQDQENALGPTRHWIEERLKTPVAELARREHTQEAVERVHASNAFGSLRTLSRLDFTEIFEAVSLVEARLRTDPAYALSDFTTRDQCRRVLERISRHSGLSEQEVAERAITLAAGATDPRARHVSYYLLAEGVTQLEAQTKSRIPLRVRFIRMLRRRATEEYQGGVIGLTLCFVGLVLALAWEAGVHQQVTLAALGALALFPLSEFSIQILNALIISLLPPEPLPKMDFEKGAPPEHATLVVVPMMLSSREVICRELEKLEVRFLANREPNFFFSLLSDFTDAAERTSPDDAILLQTAREGIAGLNARYPNGPFLLFHRDRVWSPSEEMWIGRERKRGKIGELNEFLCGAGSDQILVEGSLPVPIRYVITLDADTQLPPGTARRLTETIAHPLNHPQIDRQTRVRTGGYTIIQPRVSIALPDATATRFTRLFADTSGTDPYCQTVSDAQQDLFEEAIFHGKAIYDVRAFRTALEDRFPAEMLLSHDLIEGAHAGVGLASDIELFENLPLDYVSFSKRQHRWIRGDWQIAPWISPFVPTPQGGKQPNPLSLINRWRILDNLRRSLVPVASLTLLLFGWLISAAPGVWSLVVGLAVAIPALAPLLDRLARRVQGRVHGWQGAADELARAVVMIAFLPHQAWLAVDAIIRALYRSRISHRRLLEWQTAEKAVADVHQHVPSTMRQMFVISGLSIALMIGLQAKGQFAPGSIFLALWIASPALLHWLSRTAPPGRLEEIDRADGLFLRGIARRTWRFFDDLVGPDRRWLPPDNTQLALRVEVAERTSPTNIGLWLVSALSAADFGYVTTDDFVDRCAQTMATLQRLERYEGHLLNWYDIKTLQPLTPRYVSTVDSGNLIASLWVIEQGCHELSNSPVLGQACLDGLADTVAVLREVCGPDPSLAMPLQALRRLFRGGIEGHVLISRLRAAVSPVQQLRDARRWHESGDERSYWISRLARELNSKIDVVERYLGWIETLNQPPDSFLRPIAGDAVRIRRRALSEVPTLHALATGACPGVNEVLAWRSQTDLRHEASAWLDQLADQYQRAQAAAADLVSRLHGLAGEASRFSDGINMRFLYDASRRLFGVGYAVGGPVEFASYYDLLASECRLASLVAIAKGDVPVEHWLMLGRPLGTTSRGKTVLSWGGTMFEFLMPLLFTRTYANSLLDRACYAAVRVQVDYGSEKGIPWGVSESAYSALDSHQIYQYQAFGVPALALKASLIDDPVVAPYATMLALPVDASESIDNLKRLQALALDGPMGFYESIDFSREASKDGVPGVIIYAYMAHHQGMSLIALGNLLHRDSMRDRFHSDVRIRAFESLLFERLPIAPVPKDETQASMAAIRPVTADEPEERIWKEDTAVPSAHLQGNGHYSLMITNAGGGYSSWNEFAVTRWQSDTSRDCWGSFLYIRDLQSQAIWAATYQPAGGRQGTTSIRFSADRAEFERRLYGVETMLNVTVAPEDDVELRRLTVTNRSTRAKQLEFTSYLELALAPHRADAFHPAFSKLFVETECLSSGVLIAWRRPRSPDDPSVWAGHVLIGAPGEVQHETDRAAFLGRTNSADTPDALRQDLSGSAGAVLDPIFSLRSRVKLEPRDRLELDFLTIAASSREALLALIAKYQRQEAVARASEMAWAQAQIEFRYLGIQPVDAHRFQQLASHLLYPNSRLRPLANRLAQNRLGQSALWAYGISGDLPILLVCAADGRHLALVRELLLAHTYWRLRGFQADLVILNQETPSYDRPLHQQLSRQIEAHGSAASMNKPGGIFLRDWEAIPEDHRNLLLASASAVLQGGRGSLQQYLGTSGEAPAPAAFVPSGASQESPSLPLPFLELPYFNGLGGFTSDAREYPIYLKPGSRTPLPWINVMANPAFGAMVTESGLGCTWNGNSQSNRLTPWHNDPVTDPQSEIVYLRDDESGATWTPTALPIREQDAYRARHGQGYTTFEHNSHGIGQELTVLVPIADPVKIYRLRLRNDSGRPRRLTITYFAEWVLGSIREDHQLRIRTSYDEPSGAVLATQHWSGSYTGQVAFAAAHPRASSYSGDRTQFLGRNGSPSKPAGLERARLDNRTGAGLDPCAALQVTLTLDVAQQTDVTFLLGQVATVEAVRDLVARHESPEQRDHALAATREWWDHRLGTLQVHTPLLSVDYLLNRWLPYQALSCRFWGRSAMYQSSGAYGFRDQLQDCLAFLYMAPDLTRAHILASAARQFVEGDVQHWWHAETGMGVRTRCSDDMLWLPFAVAHYVEVTADTAILDEEVPFVEGAPLREKEQEHVFVPLISAQTATIREHCRRAIERAWRLGAHGLPLFGSGDWNDGMNRVGIEGRGESVWLAMFLSKVIESFAPYLGPRDREVARQRVSQLAHALEGTAWDGEWCLRGYFDDGTPLGSHTGDEAKIDSLPQSWAVISGAVDPSRARQAMESARRLLVDEENRIILLFTPPFDRSQPHPGYIMGYPPGVRENGGQYTHGSLWMASAFAHMGDGDTAVRLLKMMSPVESTRDPNAVERYRGEPYVVAADVSSAAGKAGRSGWTWYTGSAGWMYRIWVEEVLGFRLQGDKLIIAPVIPADWPGFEITYRYRSATYEIAVRRSPTKALVLEIDGKAANENTIPLSDDGAVHKATVWIPQQASPVSGPQSDPAAASDVTLVA